MDNKINKTLLNEKKIAFQKGDKEHRKQIQTRLRAELRKGQRIFKETIEKQFGTGRMRDLHGKRSKL